MKNMKAFLNAISKDIIEYPMWWIWTTLMICCYFIGLYSIVAWISNRFMGLDSTSFNILVSFLFDILGAQVSLEVITHMKIFWLEAKYAMDS